MDAADAATDARAELVAKIKAKLEDADRRGGDPAWIEIALPGVPAIKVPKSAVHEVMGETRTTPNEAPM